MAVEEPGWPTGPMKVGFSPWCEWTDGQTDKPTYRATWQHLKTIKKKLYKMAKKTEISF